MINPDSAARAARRLAAKMVSDQHVNVMFALLGAGSSLVDPSEPVVDLDEGVVIVATGDAAVALAEFLTRTPPQSVEVEPIE